MDHYSKLLRTQFKRIALREQATQSTLENNLITDEDKNALLESYRPYTWRFYSIRTIPILASLLYVSTRLGQTRSPFFLREVAIITSLTGSVLYLDYLNSKHYWNQSSEIVKKYTNYSDLMVIDDKRLEQMKKVYQKGKEGIILPPTNNSTEKKSDKMYED